MNIDNVVTCVSGFLLPFGIICLVVAFANYENTFWGNLLAILSSVPISLAWGGIVYTMTQQ